MPKWNKEYYESLSDKFTTLLVGLNERLDDVVNGRVTPALDDIPIGSARKMRAAILFFDIRGFTNRTSSADLNSLKKTLYMLDCVIPMVMQIIYDFDGYIEKNTGDGLMAIIGAEQTDEKAANNALNAATTIFYVLKKLISPFLKNEGIEEVNARIGIDMGTLLIARIGLPTGTSKHQRNFLTVVGPAANLSCKIQGMAGTNEIWTGDLIKVNAEEWRRGFFVDKTPASWTWHYHNKPDQSYQIWNYNATKSDPT